MTDQVTDRAKTATDADGDARPGLDPDSPAADHSDPTEPAGTRTTHTEPDDTTAGTDGAQTATDGRASAGAARAEGDGAARAGGDGTRTDHAEPDGNGAGTDGVPTDRREPVSAGADDAEPASARGAESPSARAEGDGTRTDLAEPDGNGAGTDGAPEAPDAARADEFAGAGTGRGKLRRARSVPAESSEGRVGRRKSRRDRAARADRSETPEARSDLAETTATEQVETQVEERAEPAVKAEAQSAGAALPADAGVPRPLVSPDGRDPHLDNVKFVAIVLVVAGHAWGPMLAWSHALQGVYLFLYTIHMPIFVMLSGYFSRHFTASPRQARGLVRAVVVPYLLIETAFTLFRYFADGQQLNFALQDPWWVTWFLMTLFFWRLTAPLWRVVRFPLVIAVVVALAAGSKELTGTFELGRMLQYLPFFVLGLSLRQEHFVKLRSTWARIVAVPVLGGALYLAYVVVPHAGVEWVYWRHGYEYFDMSYPAFAGIKLTQLAVTALVIAAVIALVPARRIPVVTTFGTASMYAYLLHGFVTKGADWWGLYDLPFLHSHLGIAIVGLGSVVLTLVLCSPPVRVLFSWAIQPRLEGWLRGSTPR